MKRRASQTGKRGGSFHLTFEKRKRERPGPINQRNIRPTKKKKKLFLRRKDGVAPGRRKKQEREAFFAAQGAYSGKSVLERNAVGEEPMMHRGKRDSTPRKKKKKGVAAHDPYDGLLSR